MDSYHLKKASSSCRSEYSIRDVLGMDIDELLKLFTSKVHSESEHQQHALRCRLLRNKCPIICYGRTAKESKLHMQNHLRKHITNYTNKLARNAKFYNKLKFRIVNAVAGVSKHVKQEPSVAISKCTTEPYLDCTPKAKDLPSTQDCDSIKIKKIFHNPPEKISFDTFKIDGVLKLMSRDLLPSVVINKLEDSSLGNLAPEEPDLYADVHDAFECRCENEDGEICSSKRALLSALGLEQISYQEVDSSQAWLLRTRLQRRKAAMEKMKQKQQSKVVPCRRSTKSRARSTQAVVASVKANVKNTVSEHSALSQSTSQLLHISPKKRYELRCEKQKEGAGKRKSDNDGSTSTKRPCLSVGEVIRMPIEEMQQLLKKQEESEEESSETEEDASSAADPDSVYKEEEDDSIFISVDVNPRKELRWMSAPQRQKLKTLLRWRKKIFKPDAGDKQKRTIVNQTASDNDKNKQDASSSKLNPTQCTSHRCHRLRTLLSNAIRESRDMAALALQEVETTSSSSDNQDSSDTEVNVTSISDNDCSDLDSVSGKAKNSDAKGFQKSGEKSHLKKRLQEIRNEVEDIHTPELNDFNLSMIAYFNDHTYAHKEADCRFQANKILRKFQSRVSVSNQTHSPNEKDVRIREKALQLLREIKENEAQRRERAETSEGRAFSKEEFRCKICMKPFTGHNSLYYHYRSHAGVKPFKCDICYKTFTRLHSLNYHIMIHENTMRFKCQYCNRGFRHPSHFKEHLNRHTGEEPFQCAVCGRRFRTSNSHRRHLLMKHNMTSNRRISKAVAPSNMLAPKSRPQLNPPHKGNNPLYSKSPPLPDSPPPVKLPICPFSTNNMKPVKLFMFPKNSLFRLSYHP